MMTVADAIQRIRKNHPDQRIVSGLDMGDFYAFWLLGRSVNPTNIFEIPVGSTMYAIRKKNGKEFLCHMLSEEGTFNSRVDVIPYLSSDDAAFARKIAEMKENMYGSMEG